MSSARSRGRGQGRPRFSLASHILSLQLGVILAALVVGGVTSSWVARGRLDDEYGNRALVIAQSVASTPTVRDALAGVGPAPAVQPLAEAVRTSTGANFVVVLDRVGVRLSHPNPSLIGQPVDDIGPALDGIPWIGPDDGSLGPSIRAKAPVFDTAGHVVGVVSVGFPEATVSTALAHELPAVGITLGTVLALAAGGSFLLAGRLKRQTFGLEPAAIAGLLEQREAILHGIREGMIATDLKGRVSLINDHALDLLGIDSDGAGRQVDDLVPAGRIRDLLHGGPARPDEVLAAGDRVLVANRMPVVGRGGVIGYVVTLRDRTELVDVLRELDSVRGLSDALRAQAHEFSNRLHTIAGLIELGRDDEALRLITADTTSQQALADDVARRIENPVLAALLLGKSVVAAERGVELILSDDSHVSAEIDDSRALVTIVGNLIDNALDAVATQPPGADGRVRVTLRSEANDMAIEVRDSGPGIDPAIGTAIFDAGVSSKSNTARHRGIGLALVRQAVERRGGSIDVASEGGAVFRVRLPAMSSSSVDDPAGLVRDVARAPR